MKPPLIRFILAYNYYLSYIISKNILEKFRENEINEFGCRGSLINLVNLSNDFEDDYFKEQDEFAKKYGVDENTIDDDVYKLADQMTSARIRCNSLMVHGKVDPITFSMLAKHIIEDQYVAGQVINLEDDLKNEEPTLEEVLKTIHMNDDKNRDLSDEKYISPLAALPESQKA